MHHWSFTIVMIWRNEMKLYSQSIVNTPDQTIREFRGHKKCRSTNFMELKKRIVTFCDSIIGKCPVGVVQTEPVRIFRKSSSEELRSQWWPGEKNKNQGGKRNEVSLALVITKPHMPGYYFVVLSCQCCLFGLFVCREVCLSGGQSMN